MSVIILYIILCLPITKPLRKEAIQQAIRQVCRIRARSAGMSGAFTPSKAFVNKQIQKLTALTARPKKRKGYKTIRVE